MVLVSCLGDWPGEALTFHGRFPVAEGKVTLGVSVDRAVQRFSVNGVAVGRNWMPRSCRTRAGGASMRALPGPLSVSSRMT